MVHYAWYLPLPEKMEWRRSSAAPSPQFHPADKRFQRREPDDPRNKIEDRLHQHRPSADPGRKADDDRGPAADQREDQQHARGLAPTRLGIAVEPILAVLIHKRSPQRMNSCSVNIASSAMSVDSRGVASISCTDQPIPMRSAPGRAADRKSTRLNSSH